MTVQGKFKYKGDGTAGPITSPAYNPGPVMFTDSDVLAIRYTSDAATVAPLIPDMFTIDDQPECLVGWYNWGMSKNGPYREVMFFVTVNFGGASYAYCPFLYVTNDASLIAGREPLGYPKLIADIDFTPKREARDSLIKGVVERPAGVPLAYAIARPVEYMGSIQETKNLFPVRSSIGLRNHPGVPPVVDVVRNQTRVLEGDVWKCDGTMAYTGFSAIDSLHQLPVVKPLDAILVTNAKIQLIKGTAVRLQSKQSKPQLEKA